MSDRILVTGATGLQGGAVARHLLKLGKPEVHCLTRRPDSEAAKTFKQLGAEVVKADFDDPASLKPVLRGCTGVFGVTNFWEAFLREYEQGANLIDATSEAGVGHLVLSTLPSTSKISNGAISVPVFETKARMEEHTRLRGVPSTSKISSIISRRRSSRTGTTDSASLWPKRRSQLWLLTTQVVWLQRFLRTELSSLGQPWKLSATR